MTEPNCLFCWNEPEACICLPLELETKKALLTFFVDALKEFSPKVSQRTPLYDGVDFVNEWFEENFCGDEKQI